MREFLLVLALLVFPLALSSAAGEEDVPDTGKAGPGTLPPPAAHLHVRRFAENPIIRPEMLPRADGKNINGPSLIRVPEWLPNPLGTYYLYFADHGGQYIRLAYANALAGPWKVYEPGTLRLEQAPDGKRHIASPDVHVDPERKELRMYFHSPSKTVNEQITYVARSSDGLRFAADGTRLGPSYFRVFRFGGYWYAMAKPGTLYRSRDGVTPFEEGPNPFTDSETLEDAAKTTRIRHVALDVEGNTLSVYFTRIGDCPESILHSSIELTADWNQWRAAPLELVLKSETTYEGADVSITASQGGKATTRVHAVRDPAIFKEAGHTYLLYSIAGESGIGIAEITAP